MYYTFLLNPIMENVSLVFIESKQNKCIVDTNKIHEELMFFK